MLDYITDLYNITEFGSLGSIHGGLLAEIKFNFFILKMRK
jgi:hypothetical protein